MRVVCKCAVFGVALLGGLMISGCDMQQAEGSTKKEESAAKEAAEKASAKPEATAVIPVQARQAERGDISEYFETTTRVLAERRVEVLAEGVGQCISVSVEEGDAVKKGQVLAELDRKEMEAALAQARVNVQQTKYQMQKAKEQFEKGILSSFEAENAKFMFEQAEAALNVQDVRIQNQTITAPIDGVVTKRTLQAGQMVAAGVPAFSIVDPASYILPINPPEKELPGLHIGQEAKVTIDANEGHDFTATVRRINPAVDPVSGTVKVTLDFADADRALLREAAFARVRLVMATRPNAILVPKDVIIEENARRYLMVVRETGKGEDGEPKYIADRVEIQTGLEDKDRMEVTSGIEENTLFVTLGHQTLKAGSLVSITSAEKEVAARSDLSIDDALKSANEKAEAQKAEERQHNSGSGLGGGGEKRRALSN